MKPEIITKQFIIVYGVYAQVNEYKSKLKAYFSNEKDANQVAKSVKGWYTNSGTVEREEHDLEKFDHPVHESPLEWAKANLSYNEMVKAGYITP
jgi:hypothetical protein